jgi:hypothetical protein
MKKISLSMQFYENMKRIDEIVSNLTSNTLNKKDVTFLKKVLKDICDGKDPIIALNIKITRGIKRKDYLVFKQLSQAFSMMAAHRDMEEINIKQNGKIYKIKPTRKSMTPLKVAAAKVAKVFKMDPDNLLTYWKDPKFKHLKTPYI